MLGSVTTTVGLTFLMRITYEDSKLVGAVALWATPNTRVFQALVVAVIGCLISLAIYVVSFLRETALWSCSYARAAAEHLLDLHPPIHHRW